MSETTQDLPLVRWRGRSYEVTITQYAENENTCIVLLDPRNGQLAVKASVNLHRLPAYHTFIKDYSENRGVLDALLKARLITKAGHTVRNGSAEFELCVLDPEFGEQFGIKVPAAEPPPEPAATQDTVDQAAPSNGVPPSASVPSDEDVGEAAADWGALEAQQREAQLAAARDAARAAPPQADEASTDARGPSDPDPAGAA